MTTFDDLSLLRAFVGIVENRSISAAARRLRIPQPTLSRYLRTLENSCGALLVRRDTHSMSPTQTGHRFLADAREMLAHADAAEQRLREDLTAISGHLRLFSSIDSGQFIVSRLISSFLQIHPQVTAELAYTNRPLNMIEEGCDVGVVPGKIFDESVIARPAGKIVLYLAASPALVKGRPAPRALADLKSWPWIALSRPQFRSASETTLFGPKGAKQSIPISPILLSEGVTSIREAVRAGLGISLLPDWLIREDLLSVRLVRVLAPWKAADLPVHIVYSAHRLLPSRIRAFVDFAVSYMTQELQSKA
jgi:DNA-binding transcriptional LysR family regulator